MSTTLDIITSDETPAPTTDSSPKAPQIYLDREGNEIDFDRYRVLLTQFRNIDDQWRVNELGHRERRPKI
jgi:hypothetical protein